MPKGRVYCGGSWWSSVKDFNAAISKNQIANRSGGGIFKTVLKKTKVVSRALK